MLLTQTADNIGVDHVVYSFWATLKLADIVQTVNNPWWVWEFFC